MPGTPLSEVKPQSPRRNSPGSYWLAQKHSFNSNAQSTFKSSPSNKLDFWRSKELLKENDAVECPANPLHLTKPARRASLEKLKRASVVSNSQIFVESTEAELSVVSDNGPRIALLSHHNSLQSGGDILSGHRRTMSDDDGLPASHGSGTTTRLPHSPNKSSLSQGNTTFNAIRPQDCTALSFRRHAKSVTFDDAPPQINEYDMVTPDPSSVASGSREGSYDSDRYDLEAEADARNAIGSTLLNEDSFDESLEDVDKTPVVLPEDWRFMDQSPIQQRAALAKRPTTVDMHEEEEYLMPRFGKSETHASVSRSASFDSESERRPLPPLPESLTGATEKRASATYTAAMRPQPASISKNDILEMGSSAMPLAERLHILALQKGLEEHQPLGHAQTIVQARATSNPARREDISVVPEATSNFTTPSTYTTDNEIYETLDPDAPIPSRETSSNYALPSEIIIKEEDDDETHNIVDLYSVPEIEPVELESLQDDHDTDEESSVVRYDVSYEQERDCGSGETENVDKGDTTILHPETEPIDHSGRNDRVVDDDDYESFDIDRSSLKPTHENLPDFESFLSMNDFQLDLRSYMTPSPPPILTRPYMDQTESISSHVLTLRESQNPLTHHADTNKDLNVQSSTTPKPLAIASNGVSQENDLSNFSTEDLNIDNLISNNALFDHDPDSQIERCSPEIPKPMATIKASNSRLKTRPSATPADIQTMAAARRTVSGDTSAKFIVPVEKKSIAIGEKAESTATMPQSADVTARAELDTNFNPVQIDVALETIDCQSGLGLGAEFDRLIESQKKGYKMRENEKVVIASERNVSTEVDRSIGSADGADILSTPVIISPKKTMDQTWTTEPWNGRMRRQSTRRSIIVPEKISPYTSSIPLPNAEAAEENLSSVDGPRSNEEEHADMERGRLFVKVVRIKDLELPLAENDPSYFQLTLDNGLHCVTTSWLELGRSAPIGQEFELVVFDDLEFQLTFQTKLERPVSQSSTRAVPVTVTRPQKTGMSKLFMSPKKRREMDRLQQELDAQVDLQRQLGLKAQRSSRQPSSWDLQHTLVDTDGNFARAYINLRHHEQRAFGRPYSVDVPCFNEWAIDESISSTRSKLGGLQRRPPYKIGKVELQLLYIPRPATSLDEDMPKSMSAAVRQLKEAEAVIPAYFDGHLSQQGGDCPYWRRRFFKLVGSDLKAYHEHTRQPRAKISLIKATKIVDDRSKLTQPDGLPSNASTSISATNVTKGRRRKSAFAEDEEGYMFVEEGFRIRFTNGEIIDFYADSAEEKQAWMTALSSTIGCDPAPTNKSWTAIVLSQERASGIQAQQRKGLLEKPNTKCKGDSITAPNGIVQGNKGWTDKPLPSCNSSRQWEEPGSAKPRPRSQYEDLPKRNSMASPFVSEKQQRSTRRHEVKSMIF